MSLTDAKIRTAKPGIKPVKLTDGGGLYLEVRPTGAKLWRYRYRIAGKENVYAMGEYPEISLAAARAEHDKARALVNKSPLKNPQTTSIARLHLRYRCAGIASFRYATSWFLAVFAHAYT
ncbi:Arm DNA-binding domain-containing protein, partial [Xanthomonas phaseoli]|uniref:Arm DNA-binding domain-containing protein n=1 Tax=Xanthomonas phaseoli TaxID=1985254 RepID=UPI0012378320